MTSELESGSVEAKLADVRARVARAARSAGRDPDSIVLVAVSKRQGLDKIRAAHRAGQRDFGESYAQELRDKAAALADLDGLRWHFIGHLQTNKARLVAPLAKLVHTVDSEGLARELAKRAVGERPVEALIEVNIGREPQKSGVLPDDVEGLARQLGAIPLLALMGLMCVPPADLLAPPFFAALRSMRDATAQALDRPLPTLSMGMSNDYEQAIAEGSTCIRVGTAIFGEREA